VRTLVYSIADADIAAGGNTNRGVIEHANQSFQRLRRDEDRRIDIDKDFAPRRSDSGIFRGCLATPFGQTQELYPTVCELPYDVIGSICRCVGDNQQLEPIARIVESDQGLESRADARTGVVDGYCDGD
jgi:hypothetical protein